MHHVVLDRWSRSRSFLHRRDGRAKVIALIVFLAAVATTPISDTVRIAGYIFFLLAGVTLTRLPVLQVIARAGLILPFALTFAVITSLSGDVSRAVSLVEKSYLSALAVLLVVSTTPLPKLLRSMESLGVPRFLVLVVQFLYRYLFVISEQAQHMRLAALCRSGSLRRGSPSRSRFQNAAGALGVLFARSYSRAEGTHRAMLARGFVGRFSTLSVSRWTWPDFVFLGAAVAYVLVLRLAIEGAW